MSLQQISHSLHDLSADVPAAGSLHAWHVSLVVDRRDREDGIVLAQRINHCPNRRVIMPHNLELATVPRFAQVVCTTPAQQGCLMDVPDVDQVERWSTAHDNSDLGV